MFKFNLSNGFLDYVLRIRLPLVLFVAVLSFMLTYFASRAERDGVGYAPEQPIKYSHALHAGQMKIDCQYCHVGVGKSRQASVPATATCMNCHTLARKDRPEIKKLTEFYNSGKSIPWVRVHRVPDYAYFSHVSHVGKGIDCQSCHGNMQTTEVATQVNAFNMGACLSCHRNAHEKIPYLQQVKNGPDNCWACHH